MLNNSESVKEKNRERVLKELQIDLEAEAEHMKTMSPEILREMQELQLDKVFGSIADKKGA